MNDLEPTEGRLPDLIFIHDEPADTDFFNTHTRLAEAIARSVRSNSKLQIVGLLGRWGSGKSTVVKHVIRLLNEPQVDLQYETFNYDAWLHQSDPLRRSFLETLAQFLIDRGVVDSDKWNSKINELNGAVKDTDILETPTLTEEAKWTLISLIPVPFGVSLLDLDTIKDAFGAVTTRAGIFAFWSGLLLILVPVLVWLLRYARRRPIGTKIFSKEFWRLSSSEGHPSSVLPLFINQSIRRVSSRTFSSVEPSSIEFGRAFQDLMQEAAKSGRRVVIVIDNLDRVVPEEALTIWATVRSFFLATHETDLVRPEQYHPTVILPIDDNAIRRMFSNGVGDGSDELTTSFIEKTFDAVFEVSQPVMSDWRAFLNQQMKKLFGDHLNERDIFHTRQFYEIYVNSKRVVVTPRSINKIVNRIGALYSQWQGMDISFCSISYYAINKDEIEEDILTFVTNQRPSLLRLEPDWQRQLAALHYGVALDKAAQVLIEEPLRLALVEGDVAAFDGLRPIHGFGDTFAQVTSQLPSAPDRSEPDFNVITNAAQLLQRCSGETEVWQEQAWSHLIEAYLEVTSAEGAASDSGARIVQLIPHVSQAQAQQFLEASGLIVEGLISKEVISAVELTDLRACVGRLMELARSNGLSMPPLAIRLNPEDFLRRLSSFSYSESWRLLRGEFEEGEISSALADLLRSPSAAIAPPLVKLLIDKAASEILGGSDIDWSLPLAAAEETVRQGAGAAGFKGALEFLGMLIKHDISTQACRNLAADGTLAAAISGLIDETTGDGLASAFALLIWGGADFPSPAGGWRKLLDARPNLVRSLHLALRKYVGPLTAHLIWQHWHKHYNTRDLLHELMVYQITADELGTLYLADILKDTYHYRRPLSWRMYEKFVDVISGYSNFWERLEQIPWGVDLHNTAKKLLSNPKEAERARSFLQTRLEAADKAVWGTALQSGQEPHAILTQLFGYDEIGFGPKSSFTRC